MVNTIISERNGIYIIEGEPEVWESKSTKHLEKFWKWLIKKKLLPGDIIPKRIMKRYYKRYTNGN